MEEIVERTAKAMVAEDKAFQGVLFAGLMIKDGKVNNLIVSLSGGKVTLPLQFYSDCITL